MSIDAITAKIVSDATEYADALTSEAKKEAKDILVNAESEAETIRKTTAAQSVKDAAVVKHRKESAAELEARKMMLAMKQEVVAGTIEAAIDRLANMETKAYISFLAGKIAETGIKEGELLLNEKDRKAVGENLVKAANDSLKGGKLVLSDRTIRARGGFILRHGALEINSTLEILVNSVKEAATPEVVAVLFEE